MDNPRLKEIADELTVVLEERELLLKDMDDKVKALVLEASVISQMIIL